MNEKKFLYMLSIVAAYVILVLTSFLITKFTAFHIQIVLENKTTIECIAHNNQPFDSPYDYKNRERNFI